MSTTIKAAAPPLGGFFYRLPGVKSLLWAATYAEAEDAVKAAQRMAQRLEGVKADGVSSR